MQSMISVFLSIPKNALVRDADENENNNLGRVRVGVITGLFDRKSDYRIKSVACLFMKEWSRMTSSG